MKDIVPVDIRSSGCGGSLRGVNENERTDAEQRALRLCM